MLLPQNIAFLQLWLRVPGPGVLGILLIWKKSSKLRFPLFWRSLCIAPILSLKECLEESKPVHNLVLKKLHTVAILVVICISRYNFGVGRRRLRGKRF